MCVGSSVPLVLFRNVFYNHSPWLRRFTKRYWNIFQKSGGAKAPPAPVGGRGPKLWNISWGLSTGLERYLLYQVSRLNAADMGPATYVKITRGEKFCQLYWTFTFHWPFILTNMQSYRHCPVLTWKKKKTVKTPPILVKFFATGCGFLSRRDWDDLYIDLHASLHVGFKIQFAGIVPVLLEFNGFATMVCPLGMPGTPRWSADLVLTTK